jgi:hypothetical protein
MAISGADVVEKRSNLVQLQRALFDAVMVWGERLVYTGTKDDTLPPAVLKALDGYLAESNSKLLVVLPLRDERETNKKRPPRSALMMESFEPATAPEQLVARLEVVGRHSTAALYNAAEYKRIPMRFLWVPLAKLQDGLGGKARFILTLVGLGLVALVAVMVLVPYPLKMEAKGQLLPKARSWVYSPMEGQVVAIKENLKPSSRVRKGQELILMYNQDLARQISELRESIRQQVEFINTNANPKEESVKQQVNQARISLHAKQQQLNGLVERTNADLRQPGHFWVKSPMDGLVLTGDFREMLTNRPVKASDPLLRIGNALSEDLRDWEIELKIPQKHIGQVLAAYGYADVDPDHPNGSGELWVDLLLSTSPTTTYRGKLSRANIAKEATPNRNDNNEPEPVVIARVRVTGDDIPADAQLPTDLLLTGTEVRSRIRCGNHAMGYSLFYGVWEFVYEKIVFFF